MTSPMPLPLEGIRVIDLGQIYNAPYATLLMALAGADVIKVEPVVGESLRLRADVARSHGVPFAMLNSNKRSLALDIKSTEGKQILLDLIAGADVLIENFRPGVADRLGFGSQDMLAANPRLVFASGSGFGQDSDMSDVAAMDLTIQAMAGVMDITGFPDREPVKAGPALCDFFGGIHLFGGTMAALVRRERTGLGSVVDVAMLDSVYPSMASNIGMLYGEKVLSSPRTGNRHGGLATSPYNVYPAADGYVAIIVVAEAHWVNLCNCMGVPEMAVDPRMSTPKARVEHMDEVDELVANWTANLKRDEVFAILRQSQVPAAPVRTLDDVVHDPSLHKRGMLVDVDHPHFGEIVVPHSPIRFVGEERLPIEPSPTLGQHSAEILAETLGRTASDVADLMARGVIACADAT